MTDQQSPAPTERQRAVIEAVCGLANALLCTWGRGSGATWTRKRIAERILADDAGLDEEKAAADALVPVPRTYGVPYPTPADFREDLERGAVTVRTDRLP